MKKNLRSLLCGLLALVLVCSCAGAAFAKDNGATPVISVHGMGGSGLYLNPGTEDEQPVGVFDAKSLLSRGGLIQNVLAAVGGKQTDPNTVIDQIADLMSDYRNIACDEDGNSLEKPPGLPVRHQQRAGHLPPSGAEYRRRQSVCL